MIKKIRKKILLTGLAIAAAMTPIAAPIAQPVTAVAADTFTGIKNGKYYENGKVSSKTGNIKYNGKTYYVRNSVVYGEVATVSDAWYEMHSSISGKTNYVLDVSGAAFKGGPESGAGDGNIQMWTDNNTIAQRFYLKSLGGGLYNIITSTGDHAKNIDVVNGKKGANIRQWEKNTASAQKFRIIKNADNTLSFINEATGQALDIEGNDDFANGRNIWDYPYAYGKDKGQNFTLAQIAKAGESPFNTSCLSSGWYRIQPSKNTNFSLDVYEDKITDGTNVALWQNNSSKAQMFYIKNLGSGVYQIFTGTTNASSALDADYGKTNVLQWSRHDGANQKWKIYKYKDGTYAFISLHNSKALDVAGANQYANKINVQTYDYILSANGLLPAEGQGWKLTKLNYKPTGWVGNKYVKNGEVQKGLQKINNKWYLFNKGSGICEQSGDKIYVGSFFQSQDNTNNRFYVTLDGHNFVYSKNFNQVKGRDMSFIAQNGTFYGTKTGYLSNYDFEILSTNYFSNYVCHNMYDSHVVSSRPERWAPEWFIDTDGKKYVFYSVNKGGEIINNNISANFTIYRTQVTDLVNYRTTKPVEMKFDKLPQYGNYSPHGKDWIKGFIDASVVKNGNTYYMFVKDEHQNQGDYRRGPAVWIFTSTNLTNWKFYYTIGKDNLLPQTQIKKSNGKTYNRYWEGPTVTKIGNTWHLYADEMTFDTSKCDNGFWGNSDNDMYSGRIIHLKSTNLRNWTSCGYINTNGLNVRHGSLMTVNDAKSEQVIQSIFNK